jgi:hypothetical protein
LRGGISGLRALRALRLLFSSFRVAGLASGLTVGGLRANLGSLGVFFDSLVCDGRVFGDPGFPGRNDFFGGDGLGRRGGCGGGVGSGVGAIFGAHYADRVAQQKGSERQITYRSRRG